MLSDEEDAAHFKISLALPLWCDARTRAASGRGTAIPYLAARHGLRCPLTAAIRSRTKSPPQSATEGQGNDEALQGARSSSMAAWRQAEPSCRHDRPIGPRQAVPQQQRDPIRSDPAGRLLQAAARCRTVYVTDEEGFFFN